MNRLPILVLVAFIAACDPATLSSTTLPNAPDTGAPPIDAGEWLDAGVDAGSSDGGGEIDAGDAGGPDTTTPDAGTSDGGTVPGNPLPPSFGLASGMTVTGVAAFQTVQVTLVEGGAIAPQNAPIIAGREIRFRVYVDGASSGAVTALLSVVNGSATDYFTDAKTISGASDDANRGTLFELDVPAEQITPSTELRVALMQEGGAGASGAQFPRDGATFPLGARVNGGLDIVVVPIRYGGDGSGRVPDTSAAAMDAFRDHVRALFPVADVNLTVREPSDYNQQVTRLGFSQWSNVLNHVLAVRDADGVPNHVYYMGLINPGDTFRSYCGGGCVAGIAPLNTRSAASQRGGIALGYAEEGSRFSGIHEFGHAFGVSHAPCGDARGPDPAFPYSGGSIGVWGYDFRSDTFHPPSTKDMMGYCDPQWLSDYNYEKLHERVVSVAGGASLDAPWVDTTPHYLVGLSPFSAPRIAGIVHEAPAREGAESVRMLQARDSVGRPLGWVAATEVQLSLPGTSNLLIPVVEGADHYETADGVRFRIPGTML